MHHILHFFNGTLTIFFFLKYPKKQESCKQKRVKESLPHLQPRNPQYKSRLSPLLKNLSCSLIPYTQVSEAGKSQPIHNPPWYLNGQGNHGITEFSVHSGFPTPGISLILPKENSAQVFSESPTHTWTQLPTGHSCHLASDRYEVYDWRIRASEPSGDHPFLSVFNFPYHSISVKKSLPWKRHPLITHSKESTPASQLLRHYAILSAFILFTCECIYWPFSLERTVIFFLEFRNFT